MGQRAIGTIGLVQKGWKGGPGRKILHSKGRQIKIQVSCQRHPRPYVEIGGGSGTRWLSPERKDQGVSSLLGLSLHPFFFSLNPTPKGKDTPWSSPFGAGP